MLIFINQVLIILLLKVPPEYGDSLHPPVCLTQAPVRPPCLPRSRPPVRPPCPQLPGIVCTPTGKNPHSAVLKLL